MYPHDDMTLEPVELGASIFVAVNKNMMRASDEFNLTRIKFATDDNEQMGIWDGKEFLFTVSNSIVNTWSRRLISSAAGNSGERLLRIVVRHLEGLLALRLQLPGQDSGHVHFLMRALQLATDITFQQREGPR